MNTPRDQVALPDTFPAEGKEIGLAGQTCLPAIWPPQDKFLRKLEAAIDLFALLLERRSGAQLDRRRIALSESAHTRSLGAVAVARRDLTDVAREKLQSRPRG